MNRRAALVAGVVALAPVVQVVPMFLHPSIEDGFVAAVSADPERWQLIHLGSASAAMLYLLALPALAALARSRGALLATVGALLGVVGSLALALAFAGEAFVLPLGIDAGLGAEGLAAVAASQEAGMEHMLFGIGFPAAGLGQLLLMGGLLRSREVARWKPALVVAGLIGSLAVPVGSLVGPVVMLLAVAGQAALAVDVHRRWATTSLRRDGTAGRSDARSQPLTKV